MDHRRRNSKLPGAGLAITALICMLASTVAWAIEPTDDPELQAKAFRHATLDLPDSARSLSALPLKAKGPAEQSLIALKASPRSARIDLLGGRFETLVLSRPMLSATMAPGETRDQRVAATRAALSSFLDSQRLQLAIDPQQLGRSRVTVHGDGEIVQFYTPRFVDGIEVRGSYLTGVINHGNLVLFGAHRWGDVETSRQPAISSDDAFELAGAFLAPYDVDGARDKTQLFLVPTLDGAGYDHRLVWQVSPAISGAHANMEVLVDAHTGEVLSSRDTNLYAEVKGGVLPVTNDGIVPDGVEQPGWPMPFQDTTAGTTDTGGNVTGIGSITATFFGPYVNINDNCGTDSLTQTDNVDWGTSGGTDCATPGFGGAGNTHASRTGFYELNRIIEMGRGQLPSNTWLQNRLTSNMNINLTCNAFWGGGTVNFYRSGGGCFNTGEIAGVFDHEWGHGLDDNDANPTIASPSGEGIADIYTALRLDDSCIGRNFRSTVCTGFGDPCDTCTGVRDIDYLARNSNLPHDYTWSNANCGGSVHCVGGVYSEAVWSLWKRKLQSAPYNYDNNTAHEIVNRMTYIGAGNVGTWFSGGPPFGGCGASGGYLNYLAADDDNGNLNDGTPHMQAIFDAFNDQEIACGTPTVQDSGCAGVATVAPIVATNPGNRQIGLTWISVAGASSYEVFRTEGVFGCDFGKVKIGSTAGTSFNDSGLQNGRDYSYVVIPKTGDACFGPASSCATDQPVGQPDFAVSCAPSSLAIAQGDNDTSTCQVISSFGYTGNVGLSCSGNPAGVSCAFAPASVSPPANGSANSTLTLTVSGGQTTGTFAFDVVGNDGSTTRTSAMSVQVIPAGSNGPQNAAYDSGLGAPKCTVAGSSCDSVGLLDGRDGKGPEPNEPNTLDVCNDGTAGTYHSDESNDRIVVSTLDGGNFTEGDTVEIAATVWAWSTGTADTLDLYYTADANSPSWTFIGSIVPPGGGAQTLTAQYVLPTGGTQAVRANFRYQGAASPCSTGTYDDHDDLVFTVEAAGGCTLDSECDNGDFCDGAETCNVGTGQCQAGTPPACDDGQFCNGAETCNEATDTCDAGTPPTCDDGVGCTDDSCDGGTDACVNTANDANCDNGLFCDGAETCDALIDCQAGSDPCPGQSCDEGTDTCTTNTAPTVSITAPADGSSFTTADSITFTGTAIDAEDGDLSANLSWSSSIDGAIGSGASFSTTLSEGSHTITASVTDSGGLPGSDSITLGVVGICQPKGASCVEDSECCSNKCKGKTGSKKCK